MPDSTLPFRAFMKRPPKRVDSTWERGGAYLHTAQTHYQPVENVSWPRGPGIAPQHASRDFSTGGEDMNHTEPPALLSPAPHDRH